MMRRALSFVSTVPILSFLFGTSCGGTPREVDLEVAHYRQPCNGLEPKFCLRVADPPGAPWTYFDDSIAGFDAKWGTSYRIRVEVRDVADPPMDGSSLDHRLLEIVNEKVEPAGTEFSMDFRVEQAPLLAASSDGGLQLRGGPKLICADEAACQAARAWVARPLQTLQLTLQHPAQPGTELVVTASSTS